MSTLEQTRPQRDRRATRHSTRMVARARELARHDWSISEIQQQVYEEFELATPPARDSVMRWVDEGYRARIDRDRRLRRDRSMEEERNALPPGVFRGPRLLDDGVLLELRRTEGFSYQVLARISERLYGVGVNEHTLRSRLVALGAERNPNKVRRAA